MIRSCWRRCGRIPATHHVRVRAETTTCSPPTSAAMMDGVRFRLNGTARGVHPAAGPARGDATRWPPSPSAAALGLTEEDDHRGAGARPRRRTCGSSFSDVAGSRVLNDAYNANPASMRAALETLVGTRSARPAHRGSGRHARTGRSARTIFTARSASSFPRASSICLCAWAIRPRYCPGGRRRPASHRSTRRNVAEFGGGRRERAAVAGRRRPGPAQSLAAHEAGGHRQRRSPRRTICGRRHRSE